MFGGNGYVLVWGRALLLNLVRLAVEDLGISRVVASIVSTRLLHLRHLLVLKLSLIKLGLARHSRWSCAVQGLVRCCLCLVAEDSSGNTSLLIEIRASGAMAVTCGGWQMVVGIGEHLLLAVLAVVSLLVVTTIFKVCLI